MLITDEMRTRRYKLDDRAAVSMQVAYLDCVRQEHELWVAGVAIVHYQSALDASLHDSQQSLKAWASWFCLV